MRRADSAGTGHVDISRVRSAGTSEQYASLKDEIDAAVVRVLASGRYIGGPEIESLEREFADFCGVAHAVAVASGTDALRFSLMAAGVGERARSGGATRTRGATRGSAEAAGTTDEVVTSPLTFIATTEAISQAGARFVFVDVD